MNFKNKAKVVWIAVKKDKLNGVVNLIKNYISLKNEPSYVKSMPLIVKIEPTVNCNLKCVMCDRSYWDKKNKDMTLDEFKKIIDQLKYVTSINLQGLGEPLLNKDIFSMVEYARSKNIEIGFFSNATLIDEEMAKKIVNVGLDYINISLDAANKDIYERIRKGAKFDKVIKNIKTLVKIKSERKRPNIAIWFVAMKDNFNEITKLVKLAKELGINEVTVQSAHSWGKDYLKDKHDIKSDDVKNVLNDASRLAKELGIKLSYTTIFKKDKRGCKAPWLTSYITVDGFVTPCCMQASDPRIINFGNIFEKYFKDIWNNDEYREFRDELKNSMPKVCVGCPGYLYQSG